MPTLLTKRNLQIVAGCAGTAAILLFPASLITFGLGVVLGYQGRVWLRKNDIIR